MLSSPRHTQSAVHVSRIVHPSLSSQGVPGWAGPLGTPKQSSQEFPQLKENESMVLSGNSGSITNGSVSVNMAPLQGALTIKEPLKLSTSTNVDPLKPAVMGNACVKFGSVPGPFVMVITVFAGPPLMTPHT
jgi:hypothetical protein